MIEAWSKISGNNLVDFGFSVKMKWWASQFSVVMVEINLGPFQFSIMVVDFQLIFKEICQRRLEAKKYGEVKN